MEYRDQDFSGQEVILDGNTFTGCTFANCMLVFRATALVTLGGNTFGQDIQWTFGGHAVPTLKLLATFYYEAGEEGRQMVAHILKQFVGT